MSKSTAASSEAAYASEEAPGSSKTYATLTNVLYVEGTPAPPTSVHIDLRSNEPLLQGSSSEGIQFEVSLPSSACPAAPPPAKKPQRVRPRGKPRVFYEEAELDLRCEWEGCAAPRFSKMRPFMEHVSEHLSHVEVRYPENEEPSYVCLWAACGYESTVSKDMVRHIHFHTFHTKIKSHGQAIMRETGVDCHMDTDERNIVPDVSEPFICAWQGCPELGKEFPEAQKFYWHVVWHGEEARDSTGSKQCRWEECKSAPASLAKLKDHLRSHGQERRVACPTCGGLFANRSKFYDHCKRQVGGENDDPDLLPFECSYCGKRFSLERLLRDHMRTHVNHRKCPHCDMTCSNESNLNKHLLYKHTDRRDFACEVCDFRAKSLRDLHSHLNVHLDRPEEQCPYCDYKTVYKIGFLRHIRTKHFQERT